MDQPMADTPGPGPPDTGPPTAGSRDREHEDMHSDQDSTMAEAKTSEAPGASRFATKGRLVGTGGGETTMVLTQEQRAEAKHQGQNAPDRQIENRGTWGDRVRSHPPNTELITEEMAKGSHMLDGIWNPVQAKQLMHTLMTDWADVGDTEGGPEELAMRNEALAPAKASCDESVRAWTARENTILMAYLHGQLELPHPPNFIKEIMVGDHRARLEDMHEVYFNVTLTAVVPASVRINKNAAHATLFRELFHANTDKRTGHSMMRAFQRDVKRISYDGIQTLQVVFYSKKASARWLHKALRLQKAVIMLQDTSRKLEDEGTGMYNTAQLEIQYAVRIYGAEQLGLVALTRAFAQFSRAKVLDVEYARATRTEIYDNRYHTIRFAQQQCPEALQGVTRILLNGAEITVHHFQQHLRRPCSRCLNPRHGMAKCTLAATKLDQLRAKFTRVFTGKVEPVRPAARADFNVSSVEQLLELLRQHQQQPQPDSHLQPVQERAEEDKGLEEAAIIAPSRADLEQQEREQTTRHEQPDADGFYTKAGKRNKHGRSRTVDASRSQQTSPPAAEIAHAAATNPGAKPRAEDEHATIASGLLQTKRKHLGKNKRVEALGQFGVLADSDSDNDDSDIMEVDDEAAVPEEHDAEVGVDDAPYAYSSGMLDVMDRDTVMEGNTADSHNGVKTDTMIAPVVTKDATADIAMEGVSDMPMATTAAPALPAATRIVRTETKPAARTSSSVKVTNTGRMARRSKQYACSVGLPDGAIKGMQTSMANYMQTTSQADDPTTPAGAPTAASEYAEGDTTEIFVAATPDSQEEMVMGPTCAGKDEGGQDLPIQLGQWLDSFQGREVAVTANGQCAFLAIFATTMNINGPTMNDSTARVREATELKWYVYSLMMKNLRRDVALGIVDPIKECESLHPERPKYTTMAGATAALYAYYDTARQRDVDKQVPATFWAGPHELRAAAQYLREPIIVFDVNAGSDAHVQRYGYGLQRMEDGSDHETGYVQALTDREAADYLRACWTLHVLPFFLVLRHQERHFYGVSHAELFFLWRAEGDISFTEKLSGNFEWKADLNRMSEYERTVELGTINQLADRDDVNALMLKRHDMRARLDLVHARLGLSMLDKEGITADWDELLMEEESADSHSLRA